MKNIWYISKYASPVKYGFGSRHFFLAKEFCKKGFKTIIISSDSNHLINFPQFEKRYNTETVEGVKTIWIKTKKYKSNSSFSRVLSWLDFEWKLFMLPQKKLDKPDYIIVSSLSLLTIINGVYLKKKYRAKLIFEIRDIWPLTLTEVDKINKHHPLIILLSLIEKFGIKNSDIIVGTMPNLSEHVNETLGINKKVYFIPQGLDESALSNPEEISENFINEFIPQNKFIIGYAGSIGKSNALDTFFDAAEKIKSEKEIYFVILGDGPLKKIFVDKYKHLNNLIFIPKVGKQQVQSVLKHFDVLYDSVLNSKLYNYGLSRNKWIDYMYAEKPIIASYEGFRSMLNEAHSGFFIEPENTQKLIETILQIKNMTKIERNDLGIKGKKWLIENRKFEKLATEYLNIIVNLNS